MGPANGGNYFYSYSGLIRSFFEGDKYCDVMLLSLRKALQNCHFFQILLSHNLMSLVHFGATV